MQTFIQKKELYTCCTLVSLPLYTLHLTPLHLTPLHFTPYTFTPYTFTPYTLHLTPYPTPLYLTIFC